LRFRSNTVFSSDFLAALELILVHPFGTLPGFKQASAIGIGTINQIKLPNAQTEQKTT